VSRGRVGSFFEAGDQGFRVGPEHVVVRDLAPLLGLDPFRPEAVLPAPLFEHGAKPDDMKEWTLADHAPDRRAVVRVEVAMDRDAACFGERNRFSDLATLEVFFAEWLAHGADFPRVQTLAGLNTPANPGVPTLAGFDTHIFMRIWVSRWVRNAFAGGRGFGAQRSVRASLVMVSARQHRLATTGFADEGHT